MPAPLERLDQARRVQQASDLRHAETLLRALLKDNPCYPDAWALLGNVLQGQGRHDEAIQGLGKAATLAPQEAVDVVDVNGLVGGTNRLDQAADAEVASQAEDAVGGSAERMISSTAAWVKVLCPRPTRSSSRSRKSRMPSGPKRLVITE